MTHLSLQLLTFDQPIIKIAHFVADYHFHSQGTDTKDSDGDTSYVEPESFLDDWDKWIED